MFIKEGLFFIILFTWIMLIQGRPQGESTVQTSEKLQPVSTNFIYTYTKFNFYTLTSQNYFQLNLPNSIILI